MLPKYVNLQIIDYYDALRSVFIKFCQIIPQKLITEVQLIMHRKQLLIYQLVLRVIIIRIVKELIRYLNLLKFTSVITKSEFYVKKLSLNFLSTILCILNFLEYKSHVQGFLRQIPRKEILQVRLCVLYVIRFLLLLEMSSLYGVYIGCRILKIINNFHQFIAASST